MKDMKHGTERVRQKERGVLGLTWIVNLFELNVVLRVWSRVHKLSIKSQAILAYYLSASVNVVAPPW
jgi:hypothetical protein